MTFEKWRQTVAPLAEHGKAWLIARAWEAATAAAREDLARHFETTPGRELFGNAIADEIRSMGGNTPYDEGPFTVHSNAEITGRPAWPRSGYDGRSG